MFFSGGHSVAFLWLRHGCEANMEAFVGGCCHCAGMAAQGTWMLS